MKCEYSFTVQNMVVSGSFTELPDRANLCDIANTWKNANYNPEKFPGIIIRFEDLKTTILFFSTGKFVITGIKDAEKIPKIINKISEVITKAKIKAKNPQYDIKNVVSSGKITSNGEMLMFDLNLMAISLPNVMYEPEVFPGLIYKVSNPKATFLIFSNGSLVCSGSKSVNDTDISFKKLLSEFENALFAKLASEKKFDEYEDF